MSSPRIFLERSSMHQATCHHFLLAAETRRAPVFALQFQLSLEFHEMKEHHVHWKTIVKHRQQASLQI